MDGDPGLMQGMRLLTEMDGDVLLMPLVHVSQPLSKSTLWVRYDPKAKRGYGLDNDFTHTSAMTLTFDH